MCDFYGNRWLVNWDGVLCLSLSVVAFGLFVEAVAAKEKEKEESKRATSLYKLRQLITDEEIAKTGSKSDRKDKLVTYHPPVCSVGHWLSFGLHIGRRKLRLRRGKNRSRRNLKNDDILPAPVNQMRLHCQQERGAGRDHGPIVKTPLPLHSRQEVIKDIQVINQWDSMAKHNV
jgi:hypothetical protein